MNVLVASSAILLMLLLIAIVLGVVGCALAVVGAIMVRLRS